MHQVTRPLSSNLGVASAMRLFGLTARALRFYEEKGLIEAGRDRHNRRFYDAEAQERLGWIARLRAADLSLTDIREVLCAEERRQQGQAVALALLQARRAALEAGLVEVDRAIGALLPAAPPVRRASPARGLRAVGGSALASA